MSFAGWAQVFFSFVEDYLQASYNSRAIFLS